MVIRNASATIRDATNDAIILRVCLLFVQQGCMRCHRECRTCSGPSLAFCSQCLYLKEDGKCVTNCSNDHFYESTPGGGVCRKCDSRCHGCTGPTEADCVMCKLFKIVRRDVDHNRIQMESGETMVRLRNDGNYTLFMNYHR